MPMQENNAIEKDAAKKSDPFHNTDSGLPADFKYDRYGFNLTADDKKDKWHEVINGLADKILNHERINEFDFLKAIAFKGMAEDYFKLCEVYRKTTLDRKFKQIEPKDIAKSKNAKVLSDIYAQQKILEKEKSYERMTEPAVGIAMAINCVISAIVFISVPVLTPAIVVPTSIFLIASCLTLISHRFFHNLHDLKHIAKAYFKVKKMKRQRIKELKREIKSCEKETKAIEKERDTRLKNARSNEDYRRIKIYYEEQLSHQIQKRFEKQRKMTETKDDTNEIISNFPGFEECEYQDVLKKGYLENLKENYKNELEECKKQGGDRERKKEIKDKYKRAKEEICSKYNVCDKILEHCMNAFYRQNPDKIGEYKLIKPEAEKRIIDELNARHERILFNLENHRRPNINIAYGRSMNSLKRAYRQSGISQAGR